MPQDRGVGAVEGVDSRRQLAHAQAGAEEAFARFAADTGRQGLEGGVGGRDAEFARDPRAQRFALLAERLRPPGEGFLLAAEGLQAGRVRGEDGGAHRGQRAERGAEGLPGAGEVAQAGFGEGGEVGCHGVCVAGACPVAGSR